MSAGPQSRFDLPQRSGPAELERHVRYASAALPALVRRLLLLRRDSELAQLGAIRDFAFLLLASLGGSEPDIRNPQ